MRAHAEAGAGAPADQDAVPWPERWERARDEDRLRALAAAKAGAAGSVGAESAPGATAPPPDAGEQPVQAQWRLPPIRWGGALTTDLSYLDIEGQRSFQRLEMATLRFGSYIWQPWLAQVNGAVNLLTSDQDIKEQGPATRSLDAKSTAASGSTSLSVFPTSRFPFNAYFDLTDSRTSGEAALSNYTTRRYGARQSYQPLDGRSNYSASYDRSVLTSAAFGRDTVNALSGSASHQFGTQNVNVTGQRTSNRREAGEGSLLNRLTATHSYRPDPTLSVETLGNVSSSEFRLTNAGVTTSNDSRFIQLNTFATWRPDQEELPLYVTGGGRYYASMLEEGGQSADTTVISANAAANYRWRRTTDLFASVTATQATAQAAAAGQAPDDVITTQTIGATHTPDAIPLGRYTYNWTASLALSNQTSNQFGTRQNVGGQLTHAISRTFPLGQGAQLALSGNQGYSSNVDTAGFVTHTISHTANAAIRFSPAPNSTGFLSVIGSDSRTSGTFDSDFQLVNVQANGQLQFNRYSHGTANITFQATRQSTPSTPDTGFNFTSSGSVSYQHVRAFDVPRLRYYASYNVQDTHSDNTRLLGDVNAPRERISQSLEQRLEYNIGRVEMRLTTRFAIIEGQRTGIVFFRLMRQFGAF